MFSVPFKEDVYHLDKSFGYPLMFGDFVAALYVCEAVRQFTGRKIMFSTKCLTGSPARDTIRESMKYHDYIIERENSHTAIPVQGNLFVWQSYLFRHHNIIPKILNPYDTVDRVIINPLQEGGGRQWSRGLIKNVLNKFKGRNAILIGKLPYNGSPIEQVAGDISKSMELIMSSRYYVGGETGLSLFAGAVEKAPEKIATIYGPKEVVSHYGLRFRSAVPPIFAQSDRQTPEKDIEASYHPQTKKPMMYGYNDTHNGESIYNFLYGGG